MVWVKNVSPAVDSQSRYPTIIAICVVLTVLMIIVVALRIYVHFQPGLASDDIVIFVSMVSSKALVVWVLNANLRIVPDIQYYLQFAQHSS